MAICRSGSAPRFGAVSALISAPILGAEISALTAICSGISGKFSVSLVDTKANVP